MKIPSVHPRFVLALIATPFALSIVGLVGLPLAAIWTSKPGLAGFIVTLLVSPILAVPIALVIFTPICLALCWAKKVTFWKCIWAGVLSSLLGINVVGSLPNPFTSLSEPLGFVATLLNSGYPMFTAFGAFSGAVFWLLAVPGGDVRQLSNR